MTTWNKLLAQKAGVGVTETDTAFILGEVTERLKSLPLDVLRDRARLRQRALAEIRDIVARQAIPLPPARIGLLADQAAAEIGGLGFLNELLPPVTDRYNEIAVNPDGSVWVLPKGERYFVRAEVSPSQREVWRAVEALLAPVGRSLTEATPDVDARLPRMSDMGGARIKAVHPSLVPGAGFPALNIRLFEARPVRAQTLIDWEVAPPGIIEALVEMIAEERRILISGGTATGKTTVLNGLAADGIPQHARIVKVENPEEIWLPHPNVVTIEERPAPPGSDVPPYTQKDAVDASLRMSPTWLIVGEVRTGDVALSLLRAQMSDHPGLSTFHATSPWHAIRRLALVMTMDTASKSMAASKEAIAQAVDLIVQVGWLNARRKILGIWAVRKELRGGDVKLEELWVADGYRPRGLSNEEDIEAMKQALAARLAQEASA